MAACQVSCSPGERGQWVAGIDCPGRRRVSDHDGRVQKTESSGARSSSHARGLTFVVSGRHVQDTWDEFEDC